MGLFDRDYMRGMGTPPPRRSDGGLPQPPGINMLWALIAVNAAVFLLFPPQALLRFMLSSSDFHFYQLITSIFIHVEFPHLLFNMLGLYIFGSLIADRIGFWRFGALFLLSGIIGNLLFAVLSPSQFGLACGASGALYGVMIATAMLEPDRQFVMLFLPFFPLKIKTLIVAYTIIELLSVRANDGVAHLIHLFGFLGGYLFVKIFLKPLIRWDIFRRRPVAGAWRQPSWKVVTPRNDTRRPDSETPVSQKELDMLLDKISQVGPNGLSDYERSRLRRAREQMQKRNS